MHLVDMLPPPAGVWLEKSGEAHVVENLLPVQRVNQVAHGLVSRSRGMFLVRQDHGWRNGHAESGSQRIVEEFVVGRPPEWVVDDDGAAKRRILQVSAIERNVL